MNKSFYIALLFFLCLAEKAEAQQNLVPNPSFEIYSNCPNNVDQLYLATDWRKVSFFGSSDFFHQCATSFSVQVPLNYPGFQYARTGNGYGGFLAAEGVTREYLLTPLTNSLIAGNKYCIEFYVSLSDSSRYAIDEIGMFFSDSSFSSYTNSSFSEDLPVFPQVTSPQDTFLSSKTDWIKIQAYYIALGNEQYIVIGNFKNYANTDIQIVNYGRDNSAYYYIDDVSVLDCTDSSYSNISNITVPNVFTPNADNRNDIWKINYQNINEFSCIIYNRWGEIIINHKDINSGWDGANRQGNECPDGVYYYLIDAIGSDGKNFHLKGFVQLVR